MTYFVKPAYHTKNGVPKLAIYYQAEPMRMQDGKMVTPKPVPIVIAANYLEDPATVLGAMVAILNGKDRCRNMRPCHDGNASNLCSTPSGSDLCSSLATSQGASSQVCQSSGCVKITGMALG